MEPILLRQFLVPRMKGHCHFASMNVLHYNHLKMSWAKNNK